MCTVRKINKLRPDLVKKSSVVSVPIITGRDSAGLYDTGEVDEGGLTLVPAPARKQAPGGETKQIDAELLK